MLFANREFLKLFIGFGVGLGLFNAILTVGFAVNGVFVLLRKRGMKHTAGWVNALKSLRIMSGERGRLFNTVCRLCLQNRIDFQAFLIVLQEIYNTTLFVEKTMRHINLRTLSSKFTFPQKKSHPVKIQDVNFPMKKEFREKLQNLLRTNVFKNSCFLI